MPLLLLLLLLLLQGAWTQCLRTQYEWSALLCDANRTQPVETLCDTPWCTLLQINVAGLLLPETQPWVLAARLYITATLNQRQLPNSVEPDLALLGDALAASCAAAGQWQPGQALAQAQARLWAFSAGGPRCQPANASAWADAFYYTQAPAVMVLRAAGNATITVSVLESLYATQLWLFVGNCVQFVALCLLLLRLVIYRSDKRHYAWLRQNLPGGADLSEVELELVMRHEEDDEAATDEEAEAEMKQLADERHEEEDGYEVMFHIQ